MFIAFSHHSLFDNTGYVLLCVYDTIDSVSIEILTGHELPSTDIDSNSVQKNDMISFVFVRPHFSRF